MASADPGEELKCSICLYFYADPVTMRCCGHNFCRVCIDHILNTQDLESRVYSCPGCSTKFQERPALQKNVTLCSVVEKFLSSHRDGAVTSCTYCVDSAVPAVKSCLLCEASLCDDHLRVHSKSPEHVLTDPSTSLEKRKCSVHKEFLKYYCTKDATCICMSCRTDGKHRGHRVEILAKASENKKKKLKYVLEKLMTKREKTEERVQSVEERRRKVQEKAAGEAERVTALFIDIRRRLDDLEKRVLSEISRQEEQLSLSLSYVIQKLEIKKDEMSRNIRHIEELCNMEDPLTVLQDPDTGDLCDPEEEGSDEGDTGGHDGGHGVSDQDLGQISHISHSLADIIRGVALYVQDPADTLLDINTAGNNLLISDDLKTATWTETCQNHRQTPKRFLNYHQVMSRRGYTSGRHYWDVEMSKLGVCRVGMCYPSIDREGHKSIIGDNNKSWCLFGGQGYDNQCSVKHNNNQIRLPHQVSSNRVRICLDYEAGQLSFYELCDPIRHLYTFTTTFTEPLHAALWVCGGSIKILGRSSYEEQ